MSNSETTPGQVIEIPPFPSGLAASRETVLGRTGNVTIVQLVIPQGREVPTHEFQGEAIVQCLQGQVCLLVLGGTIDLHERELTYLTANEPFSIRAIEASLLLVTLIAGKANCDLSLIGT